jgi:GINS complex subunit 2
VLTENLELMLREETLSDAFAPLPFNYMELSRILLEASVFWFPSAMWTSLNLVSFFNSASDDIPQPERIRSLLKDLREVRQGKAREGIQHLNPVELNVSSTSLSLSYARC